MCYNEGAKGEDPSMINIVDAWGGILVCIPHERKLSAESG